MHVHDWTIEYQSRFANTLTFFMGLWLLISPVTLNYTDTIAASNNYLVGMVVMFLAVTRRFAVRSDTEWASWVQFIFAFWLLFSPFVIGYTSNATALTNDVILGVVLAITSSWSASTSWVITHHWV